MTAPRPRRQPTTKQAEVLLFIAQHIREHHTSPTVRTMADHFGVQGNAIQAHLYALARKGWVRLPGKGSYGIQILGATVAVVLPNGCIPDQLLEEGAA